MSQCSDPCPNFAAHASKMTSARIANPTSPPYMHRNNCCIAQKEMDMARAIESFIDRLMGPFARELARMPASSFRYLIGGF
jgi:hypothetical protein